MNTAKKGQCTFANSMSPECVQRLCENWARIGGRRYGREIEKVTVWQRTEADPPGPWIFSKEEEAKPHTKDSAVPGKVGNAV